MEIYPCIPAIPQYGYTVCHGVPKSTTVPVPALPILENPRVFLYPCQTLLESNLNFQTPQEVIQYYNTIIPYRGQNFHGMFRMAPKLIILQL